MKRFWSDELQDEIRRLTGLCVEQQDRISKLDTALDASLELIAILRDERDEPKRDPTVAKVVDDFIQREACGMREEIAGVCISDGVNSTIVDLSSGHT